MTDPTLPAGMTDLEERMRAPGGIAAKNAALRRIDRAASALDARIASGLPPDEHRTAERVMRGFAAARAVLAAFPADLTITSEPNSRS